MKEIFFHYSEFKGDLEALQAGDDVEFTIKDRNVGSNLFDLRYPFLVDEALFLTSQLYLNCLVAKG